MKIDEILEIISEKFDENFNDINQRLAIIQADIEDLKKRQSSIATKTRNERRKSSIMRERLDRTNEFVNALKDRLTIANADMYEVKMRVVTLEQGSNGHTR